MGGKAQYERLQEYSFASLPTPGSLETALRAYLRRLIHILLLGGGGARAICVCYAPGNALVHFMCLSPKYQCRGS